jgi:superfamily II DNA or RNA helicase
MGRVKLGITVLPKSRICNYRTAISEMKYTTVFGIKCTLDKIIEFETDMLKEFEEYQIETSEQIRCNDIILMKIIEHVRSSIKYDFKQLTHDEAMLEERSEIEGCKNDEKDQRDKFPFTLKGYQIESYSKLVEVLENSESVNMNILCRCGKTILFQKYVYDQLPIIDVIIYVTSRLILIDEVNERWRNVFPDIPIYEISSNASSNISDGLNINRKGVNSVHMDNGIPILIMVCDKSFSKLEQLKFANKRVIIIFDEAHHLVTSDYNDTHQLKVLANMKFKQLKKIFVTATPKYGNYIINKNSIYMNDENWFGKNKIVFTDIKQAINQKFMTPMKIMVYGYRSLLNSDTCDAPLDKIMNVLNDIHTNDKYIYKPKKVLMFCNSTKRVDYIHEKLLKLSDGWNIYKLHSYMAANEKSIEMKKYRDDLNRCIMVNCQMISDGINIPSIDSVAFVDPRYNKENIVQIICRPRTTIENKPDKLAYCIIPVSDTNDANRFDTFFQILDELINNNDPSAVAFNNKSRNISNSIATTVNDNGIDDIKIDANIEGVVYEHVVRHIEKCQSVDKAILKILSDKLPRSSLEIYNEIKLLNIMKSNIEISVLIIDDICKIFHLAGTIIFDEVLYKYYIHNKIIKCHIRLEEFLREMKENHIYDEQAYNLYIRTNPWKLYAEDPVDWDGEFQRFKWSDLYLISGDVKYTFDECCNKIEILLSNSSYKNKIINKNDNNDKMQFLNSLDNMIPSNASDACNRYDIKKINELNKLLDSVGYIRKRII